MQSEKNGKYVHEANKPWDSTKININRLIEVIRAS